MSASASNSMMRGCIVQQRARQALLRQHVRPNAVAEQYRRHGAVVLPRGPAQALYVGVVRVNRLEVIRKS
jgi:hypothetical protein